MFPACHGDYHVRPANTRVLGNTILRSSSGQTIPIPVTLDLTMLTEDKIKHDFTFDKRVLVIPDARLIILIPALNDRLVLHRLGVN